MSTSNPSVYPESDQDRPGGSRVHLALSQLDIDIAHPLRGPHITKALRHVGAAPLVDFVDGMIKANQDLWDKMINNQFCLQMATGKAGINNFKWYMVQDMLYLKNYVYFKLGYYAKADWDTISSEASARIGKDVGYVGGQIKTCTDPPLSVPPQVVNSAVAVTHVQAYCDYLISSTIIEDWFSLHVLMLPCLIGYDTIATKYLNNPITDKDSIYYKLWIQANVGGSSPARYREFLDKYAAAYGSPVAHEKWQKLFRKSCEMEIGFWELCLTNKI